MRLSRKMAIRSLLTFSSTLGAISWLCFAVLHYPWIVPADGIGPWVNDAELTSAAAVSLAIISLATVGLAAGFFGRSRILLIATAILLAAWIGTSWWLYPSHHVLAYPFRCVAHVLGGVVLVFGSYLSFDSEES